MRAYIVYSGAALAANTKPLNNYYTFDANAAFAKHFSNLLLLTHLSKFADNFNDKQQARDELVIAERKLEYARKHPNCAMSIATADAMRIRRTFNVAEAIAANEAVVAAELAAQRVVYAKRAKR